MTEEQMFEEARHMAAEVMLSIKDGHDRYVLESRFGPLNHEDEQMLENGDLELLVKSKSIEYVKRFLTD